MWRNHLNVNIWDGLLSQLEKMTLFFFIPCQRKFQKMSSSCNPSCCYLSANVRVQDPRAHGLCQEYWTKGGYHETCKKSFRFEVLSSVKLPGSSEVQNGVCLRKQQGCILFFLFPNRHLHFYKWLQKFALEVFPQSEGTRGKVIQPP